jgi:hypothetical protein
MAFSGMIPLIPLASGEIANDEKQVKPAQRK